MATKPQTLGSSLEISDFCFFLTLFIATYIHIGYNQKIYCWANYKFWVLDFNPMTFFLFWLSYYTLILLLNVFYFT